MHYPVLIHINGVILFIYAPESFFAITLHKGRGRLLSRGCFSWDSLGVLNKVLTFEGGGRRLLSTL